VSFHRNCLSAATNYEYMLNILDRNEVMSNNHDAKEFLDFFVYDIKLKG